MMNKLIILILAFNLSSCSLISIRTVGAGKLSKAKKVNFCDLGDYKNQLIKTKCIYSGIEEYWGVRGLDNCQLNGNVYLNLDEYYDSWKYVLFELRMRKLHNKYWKYEAVVNVKGIYEESENGFGHLNTKNGQILVKSFRFKIIKKKKTK